MKKSKVNVTELQIECEELKVKNSSLEFKLNAEIEKNLLLNEELTRLKSSSEVEDLTKTNARLQGELVDLRQKAKDLEFKFANDTTHIELKTELEQLKSEVKIKDAENEHLKKLLDTYRAMPDIQNMVRNLSELAVPSIKELQEFASGIQDVGMTELVQTINEAKDMFRRGVDAFAHGGSYFGRHF